MRLWVIACVLLVPGAAAAPVDLFVHLNGGQDSPVNTQEPEQEDWSRQGMASHSGCLPDLGQGLGSDSYHTWYAFGSPGLMEYGDAEDRPHIHMERGLAADLLIDETTPSFLVWNLVARGPVQGTDALALVIPEMVLRVHVRASDEVSVGHRSFNAAPLVAFGEVGPVTLHVAVDHPHVTHHDVGGLSVYEFRIPLVLHNTTIAQADGFNIRVDAMMANPYCTQSSDGGYLTPDLVSPYQGNGLWNRWHVGVHDAVRIERFEVQPVLDSLIVRVAAMSPFGAYDARADVRVDGPVQLPLDALESPWYAEHRSPSSPSAAAWSINVTAAPGGLYTIEATAQNLQGSAQATARATFEIGDDRLRICHTDGVQRHCTVHGAGAVDASAPLVPWLAGLLVVLLSRRRSTR